MASKLCCKTPAMTSSDARILSAMANRNCWLADMVGTGNVENPVVGALAVASTAVKPNTPVAGAGVGVLDVSPSLQGRKEDENAVRDQREDNIDAGITVQHITTLTC